jgi:hypothetical protein
LLKKYDLDIRSNLPNGIKSVLRDQRHSNNSSNRIQSQVIIFEEEKRMKDEKLKLAENINKAFRQYEKVYLKTFKKQSSREEIINSIKMHMSTKETMVLFEQL